MVSLPLFAKEDIKNRLIFGLRGTFSCKYIIKEICATGTNRITGTVILNVAVAPDDHIYRTGNPVTEPINDELVFDSPDCANSWPNYRLTVSYDMDGETRTGILLDRNFRVGTPITEEPVP